MEKTREKRQTLIRSVIDARGSMHKKKHKLYNNK